MLRVVVPGVLGENQGLADEVQPAEVASSEQAESPSQEQRDSASAQLAPGAVRESGTLLQAPRPEDLTDSLDPVRLEHTRTRVGDWLAGTLGALPSNASTEEFEAALARFDKLASPAVGEGWPIVRLAESMLGAEELDVARGAARYLGRRADRLAVGSLGRALDRQELGSVLLRALEEQGEVALAPLETALETPALFEGALSAIVRLGGASAAGVIERALLDGRRAEHALALAEALPSLGAPAAEVALRLAEARVWSEQELASCLSALPNAAAVISALATERSADFAVEQLAAAVVHVQASGALSWVEGLCLERETRDVGLACLVRDEQADALRLAFRLQTTGRVSPAAVEPVLRAMIAVDAERNVALSRELLENDQVELAEALAEALMGSGAPAAAPALMEFVREGRLGEDLRLMAVLATGELGERPHIDLLRESLSVLDVRSHRLAAAHLVALHNLSDEASALSSLPSLTHGDNARLRALLRQAVDRGQASISLLRLARALEPYLLPISQV